jgi:hypothetical protein
LKKRVEIKNELIYIFLILLVSVYFAYTTHTPNLAYMLSGVIGILLIITWFVRAFTLYSGRKISQYSEVIQRISLRERFFTNLVLPILFYTSLLFFIYYNTSFLMDIVLIIISLLLLLILFINIKSSFKKVYSIEVQTRAVFDFMCIASFYMILSVIIRLSLSMWVSILLITFFSLIFFWSDIKIHRKESLSALTISLISSLFVAMTSCIFFNTNIFVIPAIGTLAFYLILSLWNIRFMGKTRLVEYLPPFLYSVLALILILNI